MGILERMEARAEYMPTARWSAYHGVFSADTSVDDLIRHKASTGSATPISGDHLGKDRSPDLGNDPGWK